MKPKMTEGADGTVLEGGAAIVVVPLLLLLWGVFAPGLSASDHADPIDILGNKPLEPGLTGLFVFPVDRDGRVVAPYERPAGLPLHFSEFARRAPIAADERGRIVDLVVILCARRGLTDSSSLELSPYTYSIHFDLKSPIDFGEAEMVARYGGRVAEPEFITSTASISIKLTNEASLREDPSVVGLSSPSTIQFATGVYDDPFIFPMFKKTNVVGMVCKIPLSCFPRDQENFIVWATSRKGKKQIDHVGRALRTQNPRFDSLNTLPPAQHRKALLAEHESPSLMRDLALAANLSSLFGFREWDFEPDVLLFSLRFPVGLPNGRLVTDDAVAILAQLGDTLAFELSYRGEGLRQSKVEPPPLATFPYLGPALKDPELAPPHRLSVGTKVKLALAAIVGLLVVVFSHLWFARWYHRRIVRKEYFI